MTYSPTHMSDGSPASKVMLDVTEADVRIVLLQSQATQCYTMQVFKYDKLIGEETSKENNLMKLLCLLLAKIPIDHDILKLN